MHTILGVGGSDHDVHACIVRGGKVAVAIEEERLTRRKYGIGGNLLDLHCAKYCLDSLGLDLSAVDEVVLDNLLPATVKMQFRRRGRLVDHHECHAAAAFLTSGFDKAAILVMDNAGCLTQGEGGPGLQATSWYVGEGSTISLAGRVLSTSYDAGPPALGAPYQLGDGDHSLGSFYKRITGALGFGFRAGAGSFFFPEDGITMGLAAYGDGRFVEMFWELAELGDRGGYKLWVRDGRLDALLNRLLGDDDGFETRAAIAAAAQAVLCRLVAHIAAHVLGATGMRRLCLSGGVAMNAAANGDLLDRLDLDALYIPPAPGDNGTAIGAALMAAGASGQSGAYSVYSGRSYPRAAVEDALETLDRARFRRDTPAPEALAGRVAQMIAGGAIVAWFEGGSEHGRRALGHRSILADPRPAAVRDRINQGIKRRQRFRPYAPAVRAAAAAAYFTAPQLSPYMQIISGVRAERQGDIAGVVHVNGTARPQTLDGTQPLAALVDRFDALTGVPMVLNTSFNASGQPIVETPKEAVAAFQDMQIDALVLDDVLVERRP